MASCAVIVLLSTAIDCSSIIRHPVRIGINFIRAIACMFIVISSFGEDLVYKEMMLYGMYQVIKKTLLIATVLDFIAQVLQKIKSYLQEFRNHH